MTLRACIVTFLKDPGPFQIKIMDGKFLIVLQKSKNGGLPAREPAGSSEWLEMLNPTEFFEGIVIGHEYDSLALTLKEYLAELSLMVLICGMGSLQGAIVTLAVERGNFAIWSVHRDTKFITALYSGVICSGVAYYVSGVIMQVRGPVFVTAFNPLGMILVAILSSFIISEQLDLGSVIGAIVIVTGLYLVIWGKSKDGTSCKNIDKDEEAAATNDLEMTTKDDGISVRGGKLPSDDTSAV